MRANTRSLRPQEGPLDRDREWPFLLPKVACLSLGVGFNRYGLGVVRLWNLRLPDRLFDLDALGILCTPLCLLEPVKGALGVCGRLSLDDHGVVQILGALIEP